MRSTNTPHEGDQVVELNGERYHLASRDQAELTGARQWDLDYQSDQVEASPQPFQIPIGFHEGGGFTWGDLPGAYDWAFGWDTITPNNAGTWGRNNDSDTIDNVTKPQTRGWLVHHEGFLYMCRGRYVTKFTINTSADATWSGATSLDMESGLADSAVGDEVGGKPVVHDGKMYVPHISSAGVIKRFAELTTVGSPDVWTTGPSGKEAYGFSVWKDLLVRDDGNNQVATCATTPTTAANWSDDGSTMTKVAPPGANMRDHLQWNEYSFFMTDRGAFTLDEQLQPRLETPDLSFINDPDNGVGCAVVHGDIMIPTILGLVRLKPGRSWRTIGPEQEGQHSRWESRLGRPICVIPYGQTFYVVYADWGNQDGALWAFTPGRGGRGPYTTHNFSRVSGASAQQEEAGTFEMGTIVTVAGTTPSSYLSVIKCNAGRTTAKVWTWRLPQLGAHSPIMDISASSNYPDYECRLTTSRLYAPGRDVGKTWRELDLHLQIFPTGTNVPGLTIWWRAADLSWAQLLDASGAAAKLTSTQANGETQRVFFPSATKYPWVQLQFRKPATGGGEADCAVIRMADVVIRGTYVPRQEPVMSVILVLGPGEFADRTSMRRTTQQQEADLAALVGSGTFTYKRNRGQTGSCEIVTASFRSVRDRKTDQEIRVAILGLREMDYD